MSSTTRALDLRGLVLAAAISVAAAAFGVSAVFGVASASAANPPRVYDNVKTIKGNVPSMAFEAQSTSEFGGQVGFGGTARGPFTTVAWSMSTFGCEEGHWNSGDCVSTPGARVAVPITVNVYAVNEDGSPGELLATTTKNAQVPYRPSADPVNCPDGNRWYEDESGKCFNGRKFSKRVKFESLALPEKAIVSIAYNTTHYGYEPIGEGAPCYTSSGGCIYDSLNVALNDDAPTVGTQPLPDDAYLNSSSGGAYCDGGAGGTGTFRLDTGCWTGQQPAIRVRAVQT